ncbi:MAG TPA: hypothetical protein VF119_06915 [Candidatus Limnocylindrales bacterium]
MDQSIAPEPEPVAGPRSGRRWLILPIVLVAFIAVAFVKPWRDGDAARVQPSPATTATVASTPPARAVAPPPSSPTLPPATAVITSDLPPAAIVLGSVDVGPIPWANESAADALGVWTWADTGAVSRVTATTEVVTQIDLGRPSAMPGPLGSRGIAVAWSQLWASDPAHRGLARIDRDTGAVAERIELWSAADEEAVGGDGATRDRWTSAWGFAVDGDSIFVPSIAARPRAAYDPARARGELWRVDTTRDQSPGWFPLAHPTGVAVGFGSVWVVACCGDDGDGQTTYSIVRLERETGGVQATIPVPVPEAIVDGRPVIRIGHDAVWVGLGEVPLVLRIDPATSSIRATVAMELPVTDLAVDDDGTIWATESETWYRSGAVDSDRCEGQLVRIDPTIERPVARTTMTCPMSVAVAGNDLWVGTAGTEPGATGGMPPRLVHLRAIDPPG